QMLADAPDIPEVPAFSPQANATLEALIDGFDVDEAQKIKHIERTTNHDVKAVEYYLRDRIEHCAELADVSQFIHFACTSEDINNLSHAQLLKDVRDKVLLPRLDQVIERITALAA